MIMDALRRGQKQEWKSQHWGGDWVRTGCDGLWDAVLLAFREYREAPDQKRMIREKTGISEQTPSPEWLSDLYTDLYEASLQKDKENNKLFFKLVPLRLFSSEIIPYTQKFISDNPEASMEEVMEEVVDKCLLLAEYRQTKKNIQLPTEEVKTDVRTFLEKIIRKTQHCSYEVVVDVMNRLEHHLLIISPQEKVLFDSKTWKNGTMDGQYRDVILVMAHPDGSYDSIGRLSYTKDGHQKISRLFNYDDHVMELLRK